MLETEIDCIDDVDKVQSVTDTDNEFTECQTPRKKLNTSLQSFGSHTVPQHSWITNAKMKPGKVTITLKNNISEAYKVEVDYLGDLESDSYDKNVMKEKLNGLFRLHEAIKEKLKLKFWKNPNFYLTTSKLLFRIF